MTSLVPFVPGYGTETGVSAPIPPPPEPVPTVTVEVAFTSNADDPDPTWVDLATLTGIAPLLSGSTSRGRSSERDTIQAGSCSLMLDNPHADFTPGNTAGAYSPNVKVDKQTRVKVTPPAPYDGSAAWIHRGFVTSWAADVQGGFEAAQTTMTATDNSDGLSLVELKSDLATEIGISAAWGYWPMSEPDGAENVGDHSGNGRRALPIKSYLGTSGIAGTWKFGADPLAPSDASTSLTLTPILIGSTGDAGRYLEFSNLAPPNRPNLSYDDGFTFLIGFRTSEAMGSAATLIEANGVDGTGRASIIVTGTIPGVPGGATVQAVVWPDSTGGGGLAETSGGMNDGKPHLAILTVQGAQMHFYLDGVLVPVTFPMSYAGTGRIDGRITVGIGTGVTSTGFPWLGDLGHLAVFDHAMDPTRVPRIWKAWQGFVGEATDDRIARYLSYVTWPSGTVFDTGNTRLGAQLIAGLDALTAINNASASEQGTFFIGPDGTARFQNRRHRINQTSVVTFNDALPINRDGLVFTEDRQSIANDVTGTRPGGTTQRVTDAQSISEHRRRSISIDLAVQTDEELYQAISWYLNRYKDPDVRCGSVVLDPYSNPQLWPYALGLEISDRITIANLPATAPSTSMDFFVESVAHDFSRDHFKTTLQLSPASNWTYWQLGVPGYSELGVTTRLAY